MEIPSHVNADYVARHIWRIENTFRNNPGMQADSRYRIANHALGVFSNGALTQQEKVQVGFFISDFCESEAGSRAIADTNNHW